MSLQHPEVGFSEELSAQYVLTEQDSTSEAAATEIPDTLEVDEWTLLKRCLTEDPDIFHLDRGGSVKDAKALCGECAVREQCLEVALSSDTPEEVRILGGHTFRERWRIKRQRILAQHV